MRSASSWWRLAVVAAAVAIAPAAHVAASAPPDTSGSGPVATNDLLPQNNDLGNCVGTVERANCGSDARSDGHTYLVFAALAAGLGFIGWRVSKGVRARDAATALDDDRPTTVAR